ncbi:unnamed protein product [Gongylonema pulchrum]|uniref:Sugar transporter SWEET n=1 Tax=Gongylonema pulchrum TaxID=637853 RepID=A0A183DRW7_9BILA|nr:unnamed protein product [Gongylonema pulchrum]
MVSAYSLDIFSEHLLRWLSIFATGTTVCLFLTGFEICWRIKIQGTTDGISSAPFHMGFVSGQLWLQYGLLRQDKIQGTTDGISSAPFHMGFVSGQLWLQYGLLRQDKTVIFVNSVAASLYTFYLFYYFLMGPLATKKRCLRIVLLEVLFLMAVHYYVHYSGSSLEMIRARLGLCCVIFNIVTVAAPLEALREVLRTRCTERMPLPLCLFTLLVTTEWFMYGVLIDDIYIKREVLRTRCTERMPLPLCFFTLLVTTEWLMYGVLIDDIYIKVPNAIATVIAVAQLLPFIYFPRKKQMTAISAL